MHMKINLSKEVEGICDGVLTIWLIQKIDVLVPPYYIFFNLFPAIIIVNKKTANKIPGIKSKTLKHVEPLLQPKCRNCSGFEEKLSVIEQSEVKDEVSLMQKHEIIRQMSAFIGADPKSLVQAEEIFESFKYMIAEYVVKHEFNCESKLSVQMVLWLEQKCQPKAMHSLNDIIGQYLTKRA